MFATESDQNAKSCLFHSSSILPANHIQMSPGSWQHTERCLGSEVFSLVFSHTTPSAVDPCWTFPMGCSLGHILSKAERAADSKDQERCQERCISDCMQAYFTPATFPWFQPLALCNIRIVTKGQEEAPKSCGSEEFRVNPMEEEFLWFIMDCWTDKSVQEIRQGGGELLTPPLPFGIEHISRQRGVQKIKFLSTAATSDTIVPHASMHS